jgi:hypothetical protein
MCWREEESFMNNKDLLGKEIKGIFEEETKDIELSSSLIDSIVNSRKRTWRNKLDDFLNKEIEIPIAPAIVGIAALLAISIVPKDILKNQEIKVINIGSSQVFIKNYKDVSKK